LAVLTYPNMSPANKSTIKSRLALLERNIKLLSGYAKAPKAAFTEDYTISGAALHYLVESIEIITDIATHILAEDFTLEVGSYSDAIEALGTHKIVAKKFANDNANMVRFRNRIIHMYSDVNLAKVHAFLKEAPPIFKRFGVYFSKYMRT